MRGFALTKGLSLNEHGLSKMVDKKKEEKLSLNIVDERGIFDYLGLVYKEPKDRIDGRAVVSKDGKPVSVSVIENEGEPDIQGFAKSRGRSKSAILGRDEVSYENAQKTVENNVPKSSAKEAYSSPKSQNKTQKNTTKKVAKGLSKGLSKDLPKDPKELESFCTELLKKKGEEKLAEEKVQNPEMPKYSAEPKSILKKETMVELPKGPTIKNPRKNKTVKIAKEPTIIPSVEKEEMSRYLKQDDSPSHGTLGSFINLQNK
jgi:hypothetical protein